MSVLGIIAEYNPFHNGHLFHFNTSRRLTQAEYSVCALSGSFMQRGEPAILDKWSRTKMALKAGIDLIIEIPVIYCAQSAEFFAYGSVALLNNMGVVDNICFGSESGNIEFLNLVSTVIESEPLKYKEYIKKELSNGLSFPLSRAKAAAKYISDDLNKNIEMDKIESLLQSPNNILGIEYMKWLTRLNSSIKPITINRIHSQYNDESLDKPLASATALRKAVRDNNMQKLCDYMPEYAVQIMSEQFHIGKGPVFIENFEQAILCTLRRMSVKELSQIADITEGLEYRIKSAASCSGTIDMLISNIKSKRYTESRIRRILINTLLGITKRDLFICRESGPKYIRVLGFSDKGRKLLSLIKSKCTLPIFTNTADYKKYDDNLMKKMIELDILSTDIYVTSYSNKKYRLAGLDYYNKPVIL